jgi:hypothetical protein
MGLSMIFQSVWIRLWLQPRAVLKAMAELVRTCPSLRPDLAALVSGMAELHFRHCVVRAGARQKSGKPVST